MPKVEGIVLEVIKLTDHISELRIGAKDGAALPSYSCGAHVLFDLPDGDTRAYSLINFDPILPEPKEYRIAVQREPEGKGGSAHMHRLSAGSQITFSAPNNDFPLQADASAVLLAGGIGITPMISMATMLRAGGQAFEFHYSGRSAGVMAYTAPLQAVFGGALHLHCDDDPSSVLDLDEIIRSIDKVAHLYVCGPKGLIKAAKAKAEAAGITADRIHFELFDAPQEQAGDVAFEVEINSGDVFLVVPGQTIIEALEDGGVDVMYDCQRGDCGICQCDVISGIPDHRDVVLSADERAAGKVMQICVSRAKSPRLVLDI